MVFWYIYTMEFYAAEREKELLPFAMAWMELESIMLREVLYFYLVLSTEVLNIVRLYY